MSYHQKRRGSMAGLGGAENCGADQQWDPNATLGPGYPVGQCMPKGSPWAKPIAPKETGFFTGLFSALTAPVTAPPPQTTIIQQAPGISTTTLAIAGGAALLLIAVIASRK